MVFQAAKQAGWLTGEVEATHVKIGSVLGEDGKILRTRSGSSLRLMQLLEEAVAKAGTVIEELRPDLPEAERASITTSADRKSTRANASPVALSYAVFCM